MIFMYVVFVALFLTSTYLSATSILHWVPGDLRWLEVITGVTTSPGVHSNTSYYRLSIYRGTINTLLNKAQQFQM